MKYKIFLLIFAVVLGIVAYFTYPIIKERYLGNKDATTQESEKADTTSTTTSENAKNYTEDEEENEEDENDPLLNDEVKDETDESGDTQNVTAEDCDNECADFKDNESDLKYCQNICGLVSTESNNDCENKVGSDKDYCYKNQAVAKTDLNICNSISDEKIKTSCKNRITEDLLESTN